MKNYDKEEAFFRAKKKLDREKAFYRHLLWYVIINVFIIALIGVEAYREGGAFWVFGTFSTAFFWGIGLLIHGISVFVPNIFFSKGWEERQIRKYMQKENSRRWE